MDGSGAHSGQGRHRYDSGRWKRDLGKGLRSMSPKLLLESHSYPHQGGDRSTYPRDTTFPILSLHKMGVMPVRPSTSMKKGLGGGVLS